MKLCAGVLLFSIWCAAQTTPPVNAVAPVAPGGTILKKQWNTIQRGETFVPMTGAERGKFLLNRIILSPGTPVRAAMLAGFDQWTNDPQAWGQGWDAYGQRVASRLGRTTVRNTIESASAAALGYDQRYIQCNCDGTRRRTAHAVAMNFITYNRQGHWVPNIPRIGSTLAAEFIGRSWLPDEKRTAKENIGGLAAQLITGSLVNVWREFSPPMMRRLREKLPKR